MSAAGPAEHRPGGPPAPPADDGSGSGSSGKADVVLYHAPDCHLCERARRIVAGLREELGFSLEEVDISGDPELEARYREWLPVVEIGGERAFTYYVHPDAFRRKLAAQSRPRERGL